MRFVPSELLQETVTRPDSTQLQTGFSGVFPFAASARTVKKPLPVFTPAGCKDYRNARQAQQLIAPQLIAPPASVSLQRGQARLEAAALKLIAFVFHELSWTTSAITSFISPPSFPPPSLSTANHSSCY